MESVGCVDRVRSRRELEVVDRFYDARTRDWVVDYEDLALGGVGEGCC